MEYFLSALSSITNVWTIYGDLQSKYPYSTRMWENMDQGKLHIWTLVTSDHQKFS